MPLGLAWFYFLRQVLLILSRDVGMGSFLCQLKQLKGKKEVFVEILWSPSRAIIGYLGNWSPRLRFLVSLVKEFQN